MKIKFLVILVVIFTFILQLNLSIAQNETETLLQQNDSQNLSSTQNETELPLQQNDTHENEGYVCGNEECEFNETISCPQDCGDCSLDGDCEDDNPCTVDRCEGTPKKCISRPKDCDDHNPATIDNCVEGQCKNIKTTECKSGDNHCPLGCTIKTDSDCSKEDECTSKDDCEDNNACTTDLCEGKPKKCTHSPNDGKRKDSKYCINKIWENQKDEGGDCDENYECISNICSNSKCVEHNPSWLESNIPWLYNILKYLGII